jgi:acetaldehyde dehydrogenase/alcohol dehydrogenase
MNSGINPSLSFLEHIASHRTFSRGDYLFIQGEEPDGCYIVLHGVVGTHYYDADIQTDAGLQTYDAGEVVGAVGVIDGSIRKISATAESNVTAYHLSNAQLDNLKKNDIEAFQKFIELRASTLAKKFRELHEQACSLAVAKSSSPLVDATVEKANAAQNQFIDWPKDKVNEIINDIASAVNAQSHSLAVQCVDESGMGVIEHKVLKIQLGTLAVAESLMAHSDDTITLEAPGVESIAMPMGVVFGMIPVTNPVETIVFKTLSALKSGNAIIISSHRKARNVGDRTVAIIRDVIAQHGAPVDLVQTPTLPANRKLTQAFMTHEKVNFILATGGPSMVKSAYRSGTPAIGVGKGNAPVWIGSDVDLKSVASKIINSKSFDNGVVCGSENNLLVDTIAADEFIQHAINEGAAFLTESEIEAFVATAYNEYSLKPEFIGQSAAKICAQLGIIRDYPIKLLLAEVASGNLASPLVREKLAPILSLIRIHSDEDALFHATTILNIEGRGHTAIIHSNNQQRIHAYSKAVDVSRVLVNSPGTQGCIGACNGLQLSWTLGCGTMGGGSTSDNVTFKHLQNTKRVAYEQAG